MSTAGQGRAGGGAGASREPVAFTHTPYSKPAAPRKIKSIRFGLLKNEDVAKAAEFHIFERNLYQMPERKPLTNGILDPRLGTTDKNGVCQTCKGKLQDCCGHFGYIRLELPVFHIGYFKNVIQILQCICKTCSRVMVGEEDRRWFYKRLRSPKTEVLQRRALFKKLSDKCKRAKTCPFCGAVNGVVKKATSSLKIVHEKYSKNEALMQQFMGEFEEAVKTNDALKQNLNKVQDDLNPKRVLELFERIKPEDAELLDVHDRPETLIVTHLPVPPVCIRPSVEMDTGAGSNEDDITMKLMQIIEMNNILRQGLEKGLAIANLMENWDFLQVQCAMYINSELPGLPLAYQGPGKPLRGFVQRLKGKQGRFRGNLSGKRVDFSGRTVISPDPNLRVDEVGIPEQVACTLTFPERVSRNNIEKLRDRVKNGMNKHPGANFVLFSNGNKQYLKYGDLRKVASELSYGDVVERHLETGDVVLFNRQPSLHKMSIMAHRVRVMPWRTFRFNECVCNPYNADFDGDEMNLHVPQTEEARAEALLLMGVHNNMCTPKNGEMLISATQDFLTASWFLSRKDQFFDRSQFAQLCNFMYDSLVEIDLPTPAIVKPVELWTGKQIFNVLISPNVRTQCFVNLEMPEKTYSKSRKHMCPADGYVCFRNSILISGQVGKSVLGSGSKSGLFYVLHCEHSSVAAAGAMNRLAKLSARWLGSRGFSIGIDDVTPSTKLSSAKAKTVSAGYKECDARIALYESGDLPLQPGCNALQTLEAELTGKLSQIREDVGKECMRQLPYHNAPNIMASCGSKGSTINIAQMVACVGQQAVGGSRIADGFEGRTLPHFKRGDRTPAAKGFVANSFYTGLDPTEFFMHTMGGREGLVDTAVKTAETGYMSRRLMKALEDLSSQYDGTVRNSTGGIVQLVYGDDGLDPVGMEGKDGAPLHFERVLQKARRAEPRTAGDGVASDALLSSQDLLDVVNGRYASHTGMQVNEKAGMGVTERFHEIVSQFLRGEADAIDAQDPAKKRSGTRTEGVTRRQLNWFLDEIVRRYEQKRIEPGTAVGAVGAQSIGEPGTQMTLKTFHFAGVASMNVTLGVPRIKEIINASKTISTPIITAELECNTDQKAARIVKGRLEKTTLGDIVSYIKLTLIPGQAYLKVRLDRGTIQALQLDDLTIRRVAEAILSTPKLKLKPMHVRVQGDDCIRIYPPDDDREKMYFALQSLRSTLPKVIVCGIPTVERAVINDKGDGTYNLLVEGTNLRAVMGTVGVKGTKTKTNHVMETESTLGIEAARKTIIDEIKYTMGSHGMSIDTRHSMLLADVMTYKGEVLGITRFGMAKMKDSVLMLASFEKTTDHLFDAAIHGRVDDVVGVSECIIMGIPMPIGTGIFRLQHESQEAAAKRASTPADGDAVASGALALDLPDRKSVV